MILSCVLRAGHLLDLRAMVRETFPGTALFHGCHTANDSSSEVATLDHRVIAFLKTCQPDISHDLGLCIGDIALGELIVCRIVRIFDQLSLRNPRPETCAFDVTSSQVCFHPFGVIVGLGLVGLSYPLFEGGFGVGSSV